MVKLNRFGSVWDRQERIRQNDDKDTIEKSLNQIGRSIQDLVAEGQLTPEQYADLITVINGKISSGNVSIYDIDKNKGKIDQSYLSSDLLSQIAGDAPVLSEVADESVTTPKLSVGSVTPAKTTFIKNGSLYDNAEFLTGVLLPGGGNFFESGTYPNAKVAVVKIKPSTEYTIKPNYSEDLTITRYYIFDKKPENRDSPTQVIEDSFAGDKAFTFTSNSNAQYLAIYLNNQGVTNIPVSLNEGKIIKKPYYDLENIDLPDRSISEEKIDFINPANDNLYNPKNRIEGILLNGGRYRRAESFPGQHIVYVEIEPNETYSIKPVEGDNDWIFSRYSVFKELPPATRDTEAHYLVSGDDTNRSEVTFKNDSEGKYLLIYLTNNTRQNVVECQVNKGESTSEYEPYGIKIDGLKLSALDSIENKVKLYGVFNEIFNYSQEEVILDDLPVDLKDSTSSDIHSLYDNLISLHPNSISKRRIGYGTDGSGGQNTELPIYEYTIKPPNNINMNTDRPEKLTYSGDTEYVTVLIGAGVHGNEKMPVYAVYKLIKNILENKNDTISSIRDNCLIKVVPVVNVSGYGLGTYKNANGVNINKNFEDGITKEGVSPYSEHETKAMKTFFETNPHADIFLDCHSFRGREGANQISYHYSFNPDVIKSYATFMRRMSNNWKDRVITTYEENEALGYSEGTFRNNATAYREAHNKYDIKYSSLIEFGDGIPDHLAYSEGLLKIGVELYANFLSSLLGRYFS